jgi:hypothetical protein
MDAEAGQACVRLPTMMGLVIEEMNEHLPARLALRLATRGLVVKDRVEVNLRQARDVIGNSPILGVARRPEWRELLEEDGVQAARCIALADEPVHPNSIRDQQVIEGAMQAAEEYARR